VVSFCHEGELETYERESIHSDNIPMTLFQFGENRFLGETVYCTENSTNIYATRIVCTCMCTLLLLQINMILFRKASYTR
jgi:hypothetical protein